MKTKIKAEGQMITWEVAPKSGLSDTQIYNRLLKIASAERQKAALEAEIKALREEIIGDADALDITDKRFSLKWTPVLTTRIDSKKLKAEKPDIWEAYSKETASKRFSYTIK